MLSLGSARDARDLLARYAAQAMRALDHVVDVLDDRFAPGLIILRREDAEISKKGAENVSGISEI